MEKHFAATAYITATFDGVVKVLLHKHKKLGIWVGVGGHVEHDENPVETVIREVKEEARIDITIKSNHELTSTDVVTEVVAPFAIMEQTIPAWGDLAEHKHLDCEYFVHIDNPGDVHMNEEFRWYSLEELDSLNLPKDTLFLAREAIKSALVQ